MRKITLIALLLIGSHSYSQIINTAPYILTVNELKAWTTTGATASTDLIATTNLAPRFTNSETQFNPALSNSMQIAYLPDGMNNFGNYYGEQSQFNLYNFTHWAYLDKLVWFGGTSTQTIQLPSSPWTNAAHKNGVKVFANVFFSPTAFGGSTATLTNFLEQDIDGHFVVIPKMIEMMQYYNFDGWFINQETATNAATAVLMHDFVRDLTAQAEALGKEVMWYDAMRLTGAVGWQNRLNANNSPFVQDDQDANGTFETRVSSSIFINFFWSNNVFPTASRTRANLIGRSSFDVFTGVDIWPGRNQGDFETSGNTFMTNLHENATTPFTSLGIFAPNCVYNNSTYTNFNNDPTDYATFYNAENHLFSGDDNNPGIVDATGFKGLANWIPEASTIMTLPFETNFCTGHGMKKFVDGIQTSTDHWHDMNKQDILPTWQFALGQNLNTFKGEWDFSTAYNGGNSLKIGGLLPGTVDMPLYSTKLPVSNATRLDITYKNGIDRPILAWLIIFSDEPTSYYVFGIDDNPSNDWTTATLSLDSYAGREIAVIGFLITPPTANSNCSFNLGNLKVYEGPNMDTVESIKNNSFVTISYPVNRDNLIIFNINWPNAAQLDYTLYDLHGKLVKSDAIKLNGPTIHPLDTNGLESGAYMIQFRDQKNISETKKIIIR